MPLRSGSSDAAFKSNVRTLMGEIGESPHVKSRAQALAIAYSKQREGRQDGGSAFGERSVPLDDKTDVFIRGKATSEGTRRPSDWELRGGFTRRFAYGGPPMLPPQAQGGIGMPQMPTLPPQALANSQGVGMPFGGPPSMPQAQQPFPSLPNTPPVLPPLAQAQQQFPHYGQQSYGGGLDMGQGPFQNPFSPPGTGAMPMRADGGATDAERFRKQTEAILRSMRTPPSAEERARLLGESAERAAGGSSPWYTKQAAVKAPHTGPIVSAVPGRTDAHKMQVPSGSYVLPAHVVSHLGQNNTLAGMQLAKAMFSGPYGTKAVGMHSHKPRSFMGNRARGGGSKDDGVGAPVDVATAGGEVVLSPQELLNLPYANGDLKFAHKLMDAWVNKKAKEHLATLKKLPGPVKS